MACRTETKTIGEHEYSVTQWPAEKAIKTQFKLIGVFGVSITSLFTAGGSEEKLVTALQGAINSLFEKASPDALFLLIKHCVVGSFCDGKRINDALFEEVFSGDGQGELYVLLAFVLQLNYGNLIKGQSLTNALSLLLPGMMERVAEAQAG